MNKDFIYKVSYKCIYSFSYFLKALYFVIYFIKYLIYFFSFFQKYLLLNPLKDAPAVAYEFGSSIPRWVDGQHSVCDARLFSNLFVSRLSHGLWLTFIL